MRHLARLVAVALMAAAASLAVPAPAAYAGACTSDTGVTVVVDFNQLGGGVQQACVAEGGGDAASSLFPAAGFTLKDAQRQPGFVCRVNDVPKSDPCVNTAPADKFWSLWWSKGDGSWKYASVGVGSLKVPDGGFVAFSWDQNTSGSEPPSAGATTPQPPASQQPSPSQPGGNGNGSGDGAGQPAAPGGSSAPRTSPSDSPVTGPSGSPDASPTDDTSGKGGKGKNRKKKPEASPGATTSGPTTAMPEVAADEGTTVADPSSESGGLPGWVAPALIGVLFAAAGVVVLLRRRRSGPVSP